MFVMDLVNQVQVDIALIAVLQGYLLDSSNVAAVEHRNLLLQLGYSLPQIVEQPLFFELTLMLQGLQCGGAVVY